MGKFFFDKTEQGIRLVWMQFNREEIQRGKDLLEEACRDGDPEALCFLARTYLGGNYIWEYAGLDTDAVKAANLLKKSILAGSVCGVLLALRSGNLTPAVRKNMPRSLGEAWKTVHDMAEQGCPFCQYFIGNAYYWWDYFTLTGQDRRTLYPSESLCARTMAEAALPWFQKALASGLDLAGRNLANLYSGGGLPANPEALMDVIKTCAALGSPEWEERLGHSLYDAGQRNAAFDWFLKAAKHGQLSAWDPVGNAYLYGEGVAADPEKALAALQKGASAGVPTAQLDLAWLYFEGRHVPRDDARAAYWAGQAATAREGEGAYAYPLLAHCMLHGIGRPKDVDGALDMIREALEFNISSDEYDFRYADRSCRLLYRDTGEICEKGLDGGDVLLSKAANAYRLAAGEFGDTESAKRLARFKRGMFGRWKLR